ncbi:hypothetical protein [Candidatus Nanohalobium constans]|uniref:Uncharacterized protein n=1 Tax=Candidatus Nanohalobium constans TaxID=2565781 RepID=A0A5Q0UFJ4_9ARCH|nr:hypothetical protein [Candidatus Nanohalobium constans]QGA80357.1 hypothetical protein LC1Nh_0456 [Candidatus Nanohalobium constans]
MSAENPNDIFQKVGTAVDGLVPNFMLGEDHMDQFQEFLQDTDADTFEDFKQETGQGAIVNLDYEEFRDRAEKGMFDHVNDFEYSPQEGKAMIGPGFGEKQAKQVNQVMEMNPDRRTLGKAAISLGLLAGTGGTSAAAQYGTTILESGNVTEEPERREVTPTQETTYTPDGTRTNTPQNITEETPTMTRKEPVTPEPQQEDENLTGREHYFNWIHGEDDQILEEVQGTQQNTSISFQAINNALEEGIENGGRNQAIANALETASQEYQENNNYEDRHTHILSALHQTLEQKNGDQWDFDVFSNMNYTQTAGATLQYSEIKVETEDTTDTGENEYAIINAALNETMNHATHTPGEDGGEQVDYKRTMEEVRNSWNHIVLPPHDVESLEERERESDMAENVPESGAALMGYQLFAGGHNTSDGFEYRPDEMLVPASEEIHDKIDEISYEQGDKVDQEGNPLGTHGRMDLQLAINERYMDEGYDEVDNPVIIDNLEETEEGWNFELREEPDWNWEQGYPATTS